MNIVTFMEDACLSLALVMVYPLANRINKRTRVMSAADSKIRPSNLFPGSPIPSIPYTQ